MTSFLEFQYIGHTKFGILYSVLGTKSQCQTRVARQENKQETEKCENHNTKKKKKSLRNYLFIFKKI